MLKKGPTLQNAYYWVVALLNATLTVFFYFGGACFDPEWGETYHAYLHGVSSLGAPCHYVHGF